MAEISAAEVMKLRKMTSQGLMDCKRALAEADGDIDKAVEILRKKGLSTLAKRAGRETTEGIVVCKRSDDGKAMAMATLCCETDFVAKSDDFIRAADTLADYALACEADEGVEQLLDTAVSGKKFAEVVTETASTTGEKIAVGDYAKFVLSGPGLIESYVHFNKKVGAMVEIATDSEEVASAEPVRVMAVDIAMHITAARPLAIDKAEIDPAVIEREKAIFAEQVKNKPPQIVERIVEGKMKKFYKENCLLEQAFVKDDSKTVAEVIAAAAAQAGGQAKVTRFVRFDVG